MKTLAAIALLVITTSVSGALHAQDFAVAREMTFAAAVLHRGLTEDQLQAFPSAKEFLQILARARTPEQSAVIRKPFHDALEVQLTLDGVFYILMFPLPAPDGSGTYPFYAHPRNKAEVPQLVLYPDDARSLGVLLRNFK